MAKQARVQPAWLHKMLMQWGRTLPSSRGWYRTCPMLQSGIPSSTPAREPWDLTPRDYDDLVLAIDNLDTNHRCAIYLAYKPWTQDAQMAMLAQYDHHPRTVNKWLHAAAARIEADMARMKEAA